MIIQRWNTAMRRLTPRQKQILLAAMTLVVIVGALGYQWYNAGRLPVGVAAAQRAPLATEWSATGYVECRTADLSAPQIGRVVEVTVKEGDRVKPGQVLARLTDALERETLRAQEHGAAAAVAQANAARATLREAEQSQEERVRRAEAEVAAARARWERARQALERDRKVAGANLAAARAQAEESRARLADLEQGARAEEIAQAEAALAAAEATATRARTERIRQERLLAEGAVPRRSLEDATEALAQAEAARKRAAEHLAMLRSGARPEEITAARARARAAEEQMAAAEAQLAGLEAEERAVEEAAAGMRAAEAALAEARAGSERVESLRHQANASEEQRDQSAAAARQAGALVAERSILAPFAGVVGRRNVDPGDVATPGVPLFSLVEADKAWVTAEVDAQDLAPVRPGRAVTITAPAHPGRLFPGKIAIVGAEALPQTPVRTSARIVRVRVSLEPTPVAARRLLKPGMEVDVTGKDVVVPQAIQIPSDALLADTRGTYLFVVERGRAVSRRVQSGYANATHTQILSGLRAGEIVVVSGKDRLKPGTRVRTRR